MDNAEDNNDIIKQQITIIDFEKAIQILKDSNNICKFENCTFDHRTLNNEFNFDLLLNLTNIHNYKTDERRHYNKTLIFSNCEINVPLIFKDINFTSKFVRFEKCRISADIVFENCKLNELDIEDLYEDKLANESKAKIRISKTEITGFLILNGLTANNFTVFDSNINTVDIYNIKTELINFQYNLIGQKIEFITAETNTFIFKMNKKSDCYYRFNEVKVNRLWELKELVINNRFIFNQCYLKNVSFVESILEDALFLDCDFGDYILYDEINIAKREKQEKDGLIIKKMKVVKYKSVYNLYRMFEMNFDKHKDYEEAGEFHKRCYEVKRIYERKNKVGKVISLLYNISSGYGENYVRSIISFFAILFIFSCIYLYSGLDYVNNANNVSEKERTISLIYYGDSNYKYNFVNDFGASLLFSISNTLPIRKDIESIKPASEWTRFFAYIEVTIQSIILTLFIIALRRKFKR